MTFFYTYAGQLLLTFAILSVACIGLYWTMLAGQFSLAHAAFMGAGAYASSVASVKWHWDFAAALAFGVAAAAALSLAVASLMALRLSGLYLAIGTLAFAEGLIVLLNNVGYLGGPLGLSGIPFSASPPLILGVLVLAGLASVGLEQSVIGKRFRALADDEIAAAVSGVDVRRTKLLAFLFGGMATGLAGVLWAHQLGSIVPGDFSFGRIVDMLLAVLIGGTATVAGPIIGAAIVVGLPEVLRVFNVDRGLLFGVILALVVILRPEGILALSFGEPWARRLRRSIHRTAPRLGSPPGGIP